MVELFSIFIWYWRVQRMAVCYAESELGGDA